MYDYLRGYDSWDLVFCWFFGFSHLSRFFCGPRTVLSRIVGFQEILFQEVERTMVVRSISWKRTAPR